MLEEEDYYDEPKCCKCYDMEKFVSIAAENFSEVLDILYSQQDLDVISLQHLLDDLGYFFGQRASDGDLQIKRQINI